MLNRSQLILLTAMATLGGSFAGLLVVGIFANDFTFAAINLVLILALFASVFVLSGEKKNKVFDVRQWKKEVSYRRAGDVHVGGELSEEFKNIGGQWGMAAEETAKAFKKLGIASKKMHNK